MTQCGEVRMLATPVREGDLSSPSTIVIKVEITIITIKWENSDLKVITTRIEMINTKSHWRDGMCVKRWQADELISRAQCVACESVRTTSREKCARNAHVVRNGRWSARCTSRAASEISLQFSR